MSCVTSQLSPVLCHMSHVSCPLSAASCQLSAVSCHLSLVTYHLSPVTNGNGNVSSPTIHSRLVHQDRTRKQKEKLFQTNKVVKNLPKKRVLCFAVLEVRSLTRSLQLSRFRSPTEWTAYPLIHTSADIATNRLNQALGADSVQIYPFVIHLIPITLEPIK